MEFSISDYKLPLFTLPNSSTPAVLTAISYDWTYLNFYDNSPQSYGCSGKLTINTSRGTSIRTISGAMGAATLSMVGIVPEDGSDALSISFTGNRAYDSFADRSSNYCKITATYIIGAH